MGERGENAMAFQSVPETAEIVITYLHQAEQMVSTMHAQLVGGYSISTLQLLADAVDAAMPTTFLLQQSVEAQYINTTVRGLELENDQEAIANANTGPGLLAGIALPGNVTLSVKKGSGLTGRSARGRLFWIGLNRSQLQTNENFVLTASTLAIVAVVEGMRVAIAATTWTPVIVSRFTGGLKRATGKTFPWTVTSAVNDTVDSQRGRLTR